MKMWAIIVACVMGLVWGIAAAQPTPTRGELEQQVKDLSAQVQLLQADIKRLQGQLEAAKDRPQGELGEKPAARALMLMEVTAVEKLPPSADDIRRLAEVRELLIAANAELDPAERRLQDMDAANNLAMRRWRDGDRRGPKPGPVYSDIQMEDAKNKVHAIKRRIKDHDAEIKKLDREINTKMKVFSGKGTDDALYEVRIAESVAAAQKAKIGDQVEFSGKMVEGDAQAKRHVFAAKLFRIVKSK